MATRTYRLSLRSFLALDVALSELRFETPITLVCGPNGAGKTRLLKGLAQTLGGAAGRFGCPLTTGSIATLEYTYDDAERSASYASPGQSPADQRVRAHLLEPPHYAISVLDYLRKTTNLAELLEAYTPITLTDRDVERISFLVNRKYDRVHVYEIDDPGGEAREVVDGESFADEVENVGAEWDPSRPLPYFEVTSFGRTYGSETMGLGELSMFCLWWNLWRIAPGSIVLIDEPEAFASPHSQYAFVDELIIRAVEKELTVVVATQSQQIIDSFEAGVIRVLVPGHEGVSVVASPPKPFLLNTLGVLVPKAGIVLTEDWLSARVIENALGALAADLLHVVDVSEVGGTGPLESALRIPTVGQQWFHLVGVFDGDQRATARQGLQWPSTFLPGGSSPESAMRAVASSARGELASMLPRSESQLEMAFSQVSGLDDHDWLPRLAGALGTTAEHLAGALARLWIANDRPAFEELVAFVRAHGGS